MAAPNPGTLRFKEISATPSAPPTGYAIFYVKTDNVVYLQDSSGTEIPLGTASGITSLTGEATGIGPGAASITLSNTAVIGKVLSGFVAGPNSTVLATDTILAAFQKLQAQVSAASGITALTGDVTASGTGSVAATIAFVGTSSAANVHAAELLANAATSSNTASTIVKRDASGNFTAGTITAALSGNASTATTATSFSGSLVGDVTGTQGATVVSTVGGKSATSVATSVDDTQGATSSNTASTIVKRDASGNFSANTITAALTGVASGNELPITATTSADYYRGDKTFQTLNKAAVGLSNVDNTSDVNKPVSTAQQTAIDNKVSDTAYNATSWDAVTTIAPSKNAVRDQIEIMLTSISGKELLSNKATDLLLPDNTKYPTTLAVSTAIGAIPLSSYVPLAGGTMTGQLILPSYKIKSGSHELLANFDGVNTYNINAAVGTATDWLAFNAGDVMSFTAQGQLQFNNAGAGSGATFDSFGGISFTSTLGQGVSLNGYLSSNLTVSNATTLGANSFAVTTTGGGINLTDSVAGGTVSIDGSGNFSLLSGSVSNGTITSGNQLDINFGANGADFNLNNTFYGSAVFSAYNSGRVYIQSLNGESIWLINSGASPTIVNNGFYINDSGGSHAADIFAFTGHNISYGLGNFGGGNPVGSNNIGFGSNVFGYGATVDGSNNIGIGSNVMSINYISPTAASNIGIGDSALANLNTAESNLALGTYSMYSNQTSSNNIAIGFSALRNLLSSGGGNLAIGASAGYYNNGVNNVFIGASAGQNCLGDDNVFVGISAGANMNGGGNVAFGTGSLTGATSASGAGNLSIGSNLFGSLSSGSYNIALAIGNGSSGIVTSGSKNLIIGFDSDVPSGTADNQMSIGNAIYGLGISSGVGTNISNAYIGIGVQNPTARLHLRAGSATAGTAPLKFTSGTVLTTPSAGSIEYDGTNLFFTDSTPTRRTLMYVGNGLYEAPLTFSTGLTRTVNTVTVNTTQNISTLSNLTGNGFVKTSGGTGALSIDTNTYLTTGTAASTYLALAGGTMTGYFRSSVVTLVDAATIAVDASLGNIFKVTLGGNRTLGAPSNPLDGQRITIQVTQDGTGGRTLAYNAVYAFGIDLTGISLSTSANATDYIGMIYRSATSTWNVICITRGY